MRSLLALLAFPAALSAQSAAVPDFSDAAASVPAEALRERLSGKVFTVKVADGNTWRLDYKGNGYSFIDTANGFRDTGTWHTEASRLCMELRKATSGCNEMRLKDDVLYMKRSSNGEVVALLPR